MVKIKKYDPNLLSKSNPEDFGQINPTHKYLGDYWMKRNVDSKE